MFSLELAHQILELLKLILGVRQVRNALYELVDRSAQHRHGHERGHERLALDEKEEPKANDHRQADDSHHPNRVCIEPVSLLLNGLRLLLDPARSHAAKGEGREQKGQAPPRAFLHLLPLYFPFLGRAPLGQVDELYRCR